MRYIVCRASKAAYEFKMENNDEPELASPCDGAIAVEIPGTGEWLGFKLFAWMINIPDLQSLHEFIDRNGRVIIDKKAAWLNKNRHEALGNPPLLEIYDGYRE